MKLSKQSTSTLILMLKFLIISDFSFGVPAFIILIAAVYNYQKFSKSE
jgi:hypothetical protein